MAQRSLDLIEAMRVIAEAAQPITGRGVGYKLFTARPDPVDGEQRDAAGLSPAAERRASRASSRGSGSSTRPAASSGYRHGTIPSITPACVARSYRRDFWNQQPLRVEVWSEKGTVRGVLQPVLDHYAVGFRVMHGFSSAHRRSTMLPRMTTVAN